MSKIRISLTAIRTVIMIMLPMRQKIRKKTTVLLMALALSVVMVFLSATILKLFIFFETSIIPTMILITKIGNYPERSTANIFIMVITITTSLPMIMLIAKLRKTAKARITRLKKKLTTKEEQILIIVIIIFIAKLPAFALHIWLPKAHVQAPTIGSIVLAGIILKLGGYGAIIMSKIIKMKQTKAITTVALIRAITITAIRLRQRDKKTIIAYSSVRHIIFILVRIVSLTP